MHWFLSLTYRSAASRNTFLGRGTPQYHSLKDEKIHVLDVFISSLDHRQCYAMWGILRFQKLNVVLFASSPAVLFLFGFGIRCLCLRWKCEIPRCKLLAER